MKPSSDMVDRIVAEVLERLRSGSVAPADASQSAPATSVRPVIATPAAVTPAANANVVRLSQRVLTLRDLPADLRGKVVQAAPQAVVTPAVRDRLKELGVPLLRDGEASARSPSVGKAAPARSPLMVGVAELPAAPQSLLSALSSRKLPLQQIARSGLPSVVNELGDAAARSGQLALLLTGEVAAAACLANRIRGVRAAVGQSLPELQQALAAIGVNFLIVDPRRPLFPLVRVIETFYQAEDRAARARFT